MIQFDLEQNIMQCWSITTDLKIVTEQAENIKDPILADSISNMLIGITELYDLKFEKCFHSFEQFLKEYYDMKRELETLKKKLFP